MSLPISELEAAIDRLYQAPIAGFTEARNVLAAERKAAGDKDGAARVKALAKPTAVAWAVNQLYWQDRERFEALAAAIVGVASAQREALAGAGAVALKEATRHKAERLQDAARAAERLLVANGAQGGPDILHRVAATLEVAASPRPASAAGPGAGRLSTELQPAGFDLALGLGSLDLPPLAPRTAPERTRPEAASAMASGLQTDQETARAARLAIQQAESEVGGLRREAEAAARSLAEAESRAAAAHADVAQLEARLQQARARAEEKGAAEAEARRALEEQRAGLAAAETALEALRRTH